MNITGKFANKERLASWSPHPQRGQVPALRIEVEFDVLAGAPVRLPMWGMVDTGADHIVVPGGPLGVFQEAEGATPYIVPGSEASRLGLILGHMIGIGGRVEALWTPAKITIGGRQLPDPLKVYLSTDYDCPLIGRSVLNRFHNFFCAADDKVVLSEHRWQLALSALLPIYGRAR